MIAQPRWQADYTYEVLDEGGRVVIREMLEEDWHDIMDVGEHE